jgi:hypothetical protein
MNAVYIAPALGIAARKLGQEMIIMCSWNSTLFSLNAVATEIWLTADGRTPLSEIVAQAVCTKFEIDPGVAYQDALHLVEQLAEQKVLVVSKEPIHSVNPL